MSTATTTPPVSPEIDDAKSEAFCERLVDVLNNGAIGLMLSIGHRTGLFDTLARLDRPATAHEIADEASLSERYIREWLGAMVTAHIVDYDPQHKTYALPAEHAAWLTRDASPNNLAQTMQWFSVLGQVEGGVVDSFRDGGGVPYEAFARFHEVMADESAQTVVAALDEHILPLVPEVIEKLEVGIDAADIGCGRGMALMHMAKTYPNSNFVGYDFSTEAIDWAKTEAKRLGLTNIRFVVRDAAKLGETDAFDVVFTFDAIHDQVDPHAMLAGIRESLREGGVLFAQDIRSSSHVEKNIDHPVGPFLYTISTMHCMTVSLANCGCGLGTCWGEELAVRMFDEAGFADVQTHTLDHDIMNNYYVCRT